MKVGFHLSQLSYRGADIAVFDYAFHNQTLLQNESVIFYKTERPSEPEVVEKFGQYFKLIPHQDNVQLAKLADQEKLDTLYFIKSGHRDGDLIANVPCAVHAVFPTKPEDFHGDRLAFVSQWLAKEYSNKKVPFVPHMIHLPEIAGDLRESLNIPKDATVLACYGGQDSFNLSFVHEVILKVLDRRKDLYFVFMNISPFAKHERLFFLPGSAKMDFKMRFINTADGMIHARGIGESFGLACAEFSIKNKPVITYAFSPQRSHIEILGDKAMLYKGKKDLEELLLSFNPQIQHQQNWDAYSKDFLPRSVMNRFQEVFLSSPIKKGVEDNRSAIPDLSFIDRVAIQAYRLQRKIRNLSKKIYL